MNWNKNCNLSDDISQLLTSFIESNYFGEDDAYNSFYDKKLTTDTSDDTMITTTEVNKANKFLVSMLRQLKLAEYWTCYPAQKTTREWKCFLINESACHKHKE